MQLANRSEQVMPRAWIERLFQRMSALYGSKFAQLWESVPKDLVLDTWAEELGSCGPDEIRVGLDACRQREWPPTLPEFLRLCRPWMNPEVAYHEAVRGLAARRNGERGEWSHPAVYWAAVHTGTGDLLQSTYSSIKARWEKTFAEELGKQSWPAIPAPAEALPAPGKTRATKEEAAAAMKKMGATEVFNQTGRDPKRWARKILEAAKEGRSYSPAVLAMANKALEAA